MLIQMADVIEALYERMPEIFDERPCTSNYPDVVKWFIKNHGLEGAESFRSDVDTVFYIRTGKRDGDIRDAWDSFGEDFDNRKYEIPPMVAMRESMRATNGDQAADSWYEGIQA